MTVWTNKSVISLAGKEDPIRVVSARAQDIFFRFIENGGSGPPFNPFDIATFLNLEFRPTEDVRDAQIVPQGSRFVIEFNPNRPAERLNYSVAHEIVHTFFPDCKDEIRNRLLHSEIDGDDWQLEMLCNIGAAELLMPMGSFPDLGTKQLTIENLLNLRRQFNVSMEALMLRFAKLSKQKCLIFSASRIESDKSRYRVDYVFQTASWGKEIRNGLVLPRSSVVEDCTAIGFTSKGREIWNVSLGVMNVECVGIAPYPGHVFPRAIGFAKPPTTRVSAEIRPRIVRGDATRPRGNGPKIIAFVVNDATPRWGAGFALALKRRYPALQTAFVRWTETHRAEFRLGNTVFLHLDDDIETAEMICQRGYGPSPRPRLRYAALESCLQKLARRAIETGASVHMPLIGSGQAGGNWSIIVEMIERILSRSQIEVMVYELPNPKPTGETRQIPLNFAKS